jgi:hypothetical protein
MEELHLPIGKGLMTVARFAMAGLFAALAGCGPSTNTLNRLADSGEIDRAAPVRTSVQIEIRQTPEKIWALIVNAPMWPSWQREIEEVSPGKRLQSGSHFDWKTGGSTIHSQVKLFEVNRRLAWTGTVFTAKAVHVWRLVPESNGQTLVVVTESLDGPLMSALFSSKELSRADSLWLSDLKKAAEINP